MKMLSKHIGDGMVEYGASIAVPCGACRACCQRELVILIPGEDDVGSYETQEVSLDDKGSITALALRHKDDGDCIYLGPEGCTIHDRAPAICRSFDCRRYFLSMTRTERRLHEKHSQQRLAIFTAARDRMHTLTAEQRTEAISRRVRR